MNHQHINLLLDLGIMLLHHHIHHPMEGVTTVGFHHQQMLSPMLLLVCLKLILNIQNFLMKNYFCEIANSVYMTDMPPPYPGINGDYGFKPTAHGIENSMTFWVSCFLNINCNWIYRCQGCWSRRKRNGLLQSQHALCLRSSSLCKSIINSPSLQIKLKFTYFIHSRTKLLQAMKKVRTKNSSNSWIL